MDNQATKSPQKSSPAVFLVWGVPQRQRARHLVTYYEAGYFDYVLHRQLESMGIENLVVRPRSWDAYGSKVMNEH